MQTFLNWLWEMGLWNSCKRWYSANTAIAVSNKVFFLWPRSLCLIPAFMKLWQDNFLACKFSTLHSSLWEHAFKLPFHIIFFFHHPNHQRVTYMPCFRFLLYQSLFNTMKSLTSSPIPLLKFLSSVIQNSLVVLNPGFFEQLLIFFDLAKAFVMLITFFHLKLFIVIPLLVLNLFLLGHSQWPLCY